ncbi:uncharacterized protein LOC144887987 [Branchiostoma floridae x Branchiostoma japonicum]
MAEDQWGGLTDTPQPSGSQKKRKRSEDGGKKGIPAEELDPGIEEFIKHNYVILTKRLEVKPIIPYLIQDDILTITDKQRILSKETKEDKAEELIDTLSGSGKCTSKQFINILRVTNQTGLIESLSVDGLKNKYQELQCTGQVLPVCVQLGLMPQTSAQGQAGDIIKEREEQILERLKELERELFTVEVFRDRKRYEQTRELFLLHKALLIDVLGGSVILLLTFLRQTDVDRFYHNHYRVGEGSLSQQLSPILISEHLQDKVKGAQLIVRLHVKHEDYVQVRDRLGRGLDRTTSVDNLLALPTPKRQVDHSSLRALDLAMADREDGSCADGRANISTLKFTARQVHATVRTVAVRKAGEKSQMEVRLQTMRGQLETARREEDAMKKEVARMRQEQEKVQKLLSEHKEEIRNLQEVNRNKELEIETMREDIKAAREQTQATVFDSVTKETANLRKKDEEAQRNLQKQQEEIQQLQETNKSMAATIEELLYEKHTAKGQSHGQDYGREGDSSEKAEKILGEHKLEIKQLQETNKSMAATIEELTAENTKMSKRLADIPKLHEEVREWREKDVTSQKVLSVQELDIQMLQEANNNMAATVEELLGAKHTEKGASQSQGDGREGGPSEKAEKILGAKKPGSGDKPVVLLLNDEYGIRKGGISTINREIGCLLASKGAEVLCTVLNATQQDKDDAAADGIRLIFPATFERDPRKPELHWLTFDHQARYPNLPSHVDFIVGHVNITSHAARRIKDRFPGAKLVQVTHVMPEDTSHYKGVERVLSIGKESDNILDDLRHADMIFSVGPLMYDYYKHQTKQRKRPHHELLPKPSDIFINLHPEPPLGTETKVVLSIGRVKGVERLKGFDLAAKSMWDVMKELTNTKWRLRGVTKEDFKDSQEIINANKDKVEFIPFTPLEYGTQEELRDDMGRADVVLMPSRAEPFGLVGLEAIAAGVPVVISHKSGLAKFLTKQDPEFDRTTCP